MLDNLGEKIFFFLNSGVFNALACLIVSVTVTFEVFALVTYLPRA